MIIGQEERLRQIAAEHMGRRSRVIAVTSGKGGVGKTNLAINLAIAAAEMRKKVILLDVDLGLANIDVLLNVRNARYGIEDIVSGRCGIAEAISTTEEGVCVIRGAVGLNHLADLDDEGRIRLISSFLVLEAKADIIILDTGAGISKNVVAFAAASDEILIVATPEPTAITDAFAMIKVLSRFSEIGNVRLIVNMAENRFEAKKISEMIRGNAQRHFNLFVEDAGYVIKDPRVVWAVKRRKPFILAYPHTSASHCARAVARRLFKDEPARKEYAAGGLIKRLAGFFSGGNAAL